MKMKKGRKRAVIGAVAGVVLGATAAFAYFTTTGSGAGTAQTGSGTAVSITQIGAGYDSLVTTNDPNTAYIQDQCLDCASISQFGNDVTLANSAPMQRLISAVVAFRNWGPAVSNVPITLTLSSGQSQTVVQNVPADQPNGRPTTFNVTFPFATHPYVPNEFVYSISFPTAYSDPGNTQPHADGLNVALSDSFTQLSVGTDTHPGTVWVQTNQGAGIAGDFPSCTVPSGNTWQQVPVNCGPSAPGNPGAYGNTNPPTGNADIPAVEFNVLGGTAAPLYPGAPGQPVDFAVTNPGGSSVHVGTALTIKVGDGVNASSSTGSGGCNAANVGSPVQVAWYQLSPYTDSAGLQENLTNGGSGWTIPPGTTYFSPTGVSIQMIDSGTNQDACENATVILGFSAS